MRGFQCYLYAYSNDKFTKNANEACWAGIKNYHPYNAKDIYIDNFTQPETKEHINLMVSIINEITPCEIATVDGKQYIKYRLLSTYDQNLILLNFIRNLWSDPHKDTGWPSYKKYTPTFFEALQKREYEDPLEHLTSCNKIACKEAAAASIGHSNIHNSDALRIRNKKELLEYKGYSTVEFLAVE